VRPHANGATLDLRAVAVKLAAFGSVDENAFFVRCQLTEPRLTLTIFPDGRALVHGTSDKSLARSAYARYIGA
jgi:TATA-box binding protein (TBP) (component of TFIID and TFIIIB)